MTLSARQVSVGSRYEAVVVSDLTRTQIVQYAGASGDYNPLHHDEVFATEVARQPTVFAHGMLTMAMTGRMLTDWVGDGRLAAFGLRFGAQVWPGDTLSAVATVEAMEYAENAIIASLSVVTLNQSAESVATGYARVRLDK